MNTKKIVVFLVMALMLVFQVVPVSAQGKTPANPDQLTAAQMKSAVMVNDGSIASRSNKRAEIYRFASCDGAREDVPCYFMVTGQGSFTESTNASSITPLSSSATISCGINVYNGIGANVAKLKQNVNVTFSGTYGQTPVTLNWGDLRGTMAIPGYSWSGLTGPTPNPNWGVYVSRTGTAYSNAGGTLAFTPPVLPPLQTIVTSRLRINSSGWACS